MTACRNSRIFRLALAFAVTLSLLSAPLGSSGSHDPAALAQAEAKRHAALAEPDGDPEQGRGQAHGHGHDHEHADGWPEERQAGHAHGHNPADHTHDVPAPLALAGYGFLKPGGAWHAPAPPSHDPDPSFGIDRPPRA